MSKNITLRIDEDLLRQARRYAAQRDASLNQLVRDYLRDVVNHENRAAGARERLLSLSGRSTARIGKAQLGRGAIYDR